MSQVVPVSATQSYVFDKKYMLLNSIGRGHNSIIYKAKRLLPEGTPGSDQLLAIKIVTGNTRTPQRNVERVKREALGLLASRHPNVLQMIDYVVEGEYCYLVVEYAECGDLRATLERRTSPFLPDTVLHVALKVLEGLEVIHRAGIIHRDLKPENLLLFSDGTVKIADFGVSLLPSDDKETAKASSSVGTLDYLAPECLEGAGCSEASDIYCLGVTCYQLLTKHMPFEGQSFAQVVENKVSGNSIPLERFLSSPPALLNDLFKQAFHANSELRFQNVEEFRRAITEFLAGTWTPKQSNSEAASHARLRDIELDEELEDLDSHDYKLDEDEFSDEEEVTEVRRNKPVPKAFYKKISPKIYAIGGALCLLAIIAVGVKEIFTGKPATIPPLAVNEATPVTKPESRAQMAAAEPATSYSGTLFGLLSDAEKTPLHLETQKNQSFSILILGLPGWTPQVIDIRSLKPGQTTSIAGNGLQLTFAVDNSSDDLLSAGSLSGTFKENGTGREGRWVLNAQPTAAQAL